MRRFPSEFPEIPPWERTLMMAEYVLEREEEVEALRTAREERDRRTPSERAASKAADAVADLEERRRRRSEPH